MFTGIITDIGEIIARSEQGGFIRLKIACRYNRETIALGASIACGGPCLTVISTGVTPEGLTTFDVDVAAETLARTTAGSWAIGTRLNLERSLKVGDEMGGHMVTGHIDGLGEIIVREEIGATARFDIAAPLHLAPFIAEKGSVALDGTSLTVNSVTENRFSVLLIPHTLQVTTWGARGAGDKLNLEVDLMARYAARLAQTQHIG